MMYLSKYLYIYKKNVADKNLQAIGGCTISYNRIEPILSIGKHEIENNKNNITYNKRTDE